MSSPQLTSAAIQTQLDTWLDVEFSFLKTAPLAQGIAGLPAEQQRFILDWVRRVASIHVNLAYRFAWNVIGHLGHLDPATLEAWALHAMDRYDQGGLHAAMEVIEDVGRFIAQSRARAVGAKFEPSSRVLLPFLQGLSGRRLALVEGEVACTDSETIFLPPLLALLDDEESNFHLYKAMAVHQWALVRYGTFRVDPQLLFARCRDPQKALTIFHRLETLRLDGIIARELPGLYRQMEALEQSHARTSLTPAWQQAQQALSAPGADVYISVDWLARLQDEELPAPRCYQGRIDWAAVSAVRDKRLARERALLRIALGELAREHLTPSASNHSSARFTLQLDDVDPDTVELHLDDQPVAIPESLKGVIGSIMQDLGEVPEEYLVAAGPGEYDPALFIERKADPDAVWQGTYHEEGAYLYDEWDYQRQHYHKHWCAVREKELAPVE
ncbi:MAG TPA: nitric oxide reductase activation protein, partial [Gammaproteobacteria bacterium]